MKISMSGPCSCQRKNPKLDTVKKENEMFLIYKEIQTRAVAKSFMRKGFLIIGNAQIFSHI
jgi:hypothetical protein